MGVASGRVSRRCVWLVVKRYIDILTIIINFRYSTCINSFFGSSILTSLFILKMFFRSCRIYRLYDSYSPVDLPR